MFSFAPFPNKVWSMNGHETMHESSTTSEDLDDTALLNTSWPLFYVGINEEVLWLQPTDQLRCRPKKPNNFMSKVESFAWFLAQFVTTLSIYINQENLCYCNLGKCCCGDRPHKANAFLRKVCSERKVPASRDYMFLKECAYCKGIGKPFVGHQKTSCPVLFAMRPCSLCGADGYENHTLSHCPYQQKVNLALKDEHRFGKETRQTKRYEERHELYSNNIVNSANLEEI
ncbi:nanos RNA binding domain protein [Dictyocaulus viviparus]|uniref:Nanos RNA binding domain protein n=1 Tax=Dictyocaulus viviparus TaxID=29172 RepID=A0A0D8XW02_DICVI|nr:nanos RNA binding domain protein [Dictyocaulus viviparus]